MPDRYRCAACGNVTRFDVVATRRTRAFHHYSIGGDLEIEEEDVLDEQIEEVRCRWCGGDGVPMTDEADATAATPDDPAPGNPAPGNPAPGNPGA